ncbi:GNAT family N-acetyltransferase [Bacillus luteolus]|uniref:GNAT family N-acetyltransferase n=1 Tax=Litchfieldia luteola TaxID=682179 RepID=A0ABR9QLA0_9BACI|nr:GNAT family N-acetyltransferase [Cytobacillus luteolus]MBE4909277.1 GNAT family N-acetyltransferase [Cytobacillus luteolus]MBP1940671.1 GNAT superfamily N-acetyltransferase [Cytobacillus luteolus]
MELVLTNDLAIKIEKSEIDCLYSRLSAIQARVGNPMGVSIEKFGQATAFSVKNIPGPAFNTVKGLSAGDEDYIEDILNFYKEKDIPVRFELPPAQVSKELLSYLSKKGFLQTDFHSSLYSALDTECEEGDELIHVRELDKSEYDLFGELYIQGFQMPSFLKSAIAENNEVLYNIDGWKFYLATFEKESAGIGVLFHKDGIATLAAATTVPEYRNKGVQTALLKGRINQAIRQNCNLVVGQARYGSISQNNMERVGLKIAYTKAIWTMG